jgi:spore coat polysaccharide biosynthesis protein SpsF
LQLLQIVSLKLQKKCHLDKLNSILELGPNIGLNLIAFKTLFPPADLAAVEINEKAAKELKKNIPEVDLYLSSISDFEIGKTWDLVFTKTVLIHINPETLNQVYDVMHRCSSRYLLIAEYYDPNPTEILYRGHSKKLYQRDFAGEILDRFKDLKLLDYGFAYHRDANFSQDDLTWFLLEKRFAGNK